MCANDNSTTTRAIVTDYFNWRLNNQSITNNRLFLIVRKIGNDCGINYRSQPSTFDVHFSSTLIDIQILNNIKKIHKEIAKELFNNDGITWTRIIAFISFSAILAEQIIQQRQNTLSSNLIISSIIDWTTNFIDTDLHVWLQNQNNWAGFLKMYDKTPQRRNSISRYAGILGTIGMITLGALYMRRI